MPTFTMAKAKEKLARAVQKASPEQLEVFHDEMFPYQPIPSPVPAEKLVRYVRDELEPSSAVDLWHVVFPEDRNIWYDEEEEVIHVNGEPLRYLE
jgi:hypothetical protein